MKYRREYRLAFACFLLSLLCFLASARSGSKEVAARIAPELLRFHVLANSNSAADQAVKLKVKSLLLDELAQAPDNGGSAKTAEGNLSSPASSPEKAAICRYIIKKRRALEESAAACVKAQGYDYGVHIELAREYFPTKAYGDIVLPCGVYDAVRVTLGEGRGRNWWCLIYPRLCFIDSTHAVVPEDSKAELRDLVGEDDYAALLTQDGIQFQIRFKLWDWLVSHLADKRQDGTAPITAPSALTG